MKPIKAELFTHGRLCLFGEHSDWAAEYGIHPGFCLVIGTDQGLSATAEPSDSFFVESVLYDSLGRPTAKTGCIRYPWQADVLLNVAQDESEFFRYCAGVAYEVMTTCHVPRESMGWG